MFGCCAAAAAAAAALGKVLQPIVTMHGSQRLQPFGHSVCLQHLIGCIASSSYHFLLWKQKPATSCCRDTYVAKFGCQVALCVWDVAWIVRLTTIPGSASTASPAGVGF